MKVICTSGSFCAFDFPPGEPLSAALVLALLSEHAKPDGNIDDLCLEIAGQYVPIAHASELSVISALLVAHAATHEARFNEVRPAPLCICPCGTPPPQPTCQPAARAPRTQKTRACARNAASPAAATPSAPAPPSALPIAALPAALLSRRTPRS